MWAVARYDFGLTDEEFGELTVPQFWLLWQRQQMTFRRDCYLAGIQASATYNVHRTEQKQRVFTAFDFVPQTADDAEKEDIVHLLTGWKSQLKASPAKVREVMREKIAEMGRNDADEILDRVLGAVN